MYGTALRRGRALCGLAGLLWGVGLLPAEATTFTASNGGQLRQALTDAGYGDTVNLTAGPFEGPFTLPGNKTGSGWITIQSALTGLPAPGTRVNPSHASAMPRLVPSSTSTAVTDVVVSAAPGAHHYKLIGLNITSDRYLTNLVQIGNWNESSVASLPYAFIFERCYIHAGAQGARRGIAMNGGSGQVKRLANGRIDWPNSETGIQVTDSYFGNLIDKTYESQAVASWNGAGPFRLENNYFEASGENVMFGGGDPSITGLIPSDIEILGNHFKKSLNWQSQGYVVKNLFELKNAQRALIQGNVFENNWIGANQLGYAIVFTPRNQDGRSPWSTVKDIEFAYNKVLNSPQGMAILGRDDIYSSDRLQNISLRNNLFDLQRPDTIGRGRLFQIGNGTYQVTIDHNTGLQDKNVIFAYALPNGLFRFTNNLFRHNACAAGNNDCGVAGDAANPGDATITQYFPNSVFRQNVLFVGGNAGANTQAVICSSIPTGFPETIGQVGFNSDGFSLSSSSPYARRGVNDGNCTPDNLDIGADIAGVNAAAAAAIAGVRLETPAAPVNRPPTASFTYACTGLSCNFNAGASSDSDGRIVSYAWKFGDTSSGSEVSTSHTYATGGTYTVPLTVTDDDQATGTTSQTVTVSPAHRPHAFQRHRSEEVAF